MGKKSKYPSYSAGSVTVNGKEVASSTKNGNTISGTYNMNDTEKEIYEGVQQNLASSLSDLFSISDEKQEQFNSELEAYKQSGLKNIEDIYTPMETSLKNDIASRFGNFDNSIFMDNLSKITDNKAQAVADFSDSLLQKQSELYSQEIANRLSYITLLSGLNTAMNNNILNFTSAARANSDSGNNYNASAYNAQNSGSSFLTDLTNLGTTALSFYKPISSLITQKNSQKTQTSAK
ncbi:MAG: hypothetical protein ACI37Q_05605 [Candidatus Gastranaerophilaceae bacterium]